ncbi:MAG: iron-containing alcohol dehydrogenase [Eubacteriaceae bacterium]
MNELKFYGEKLFIGENALESLRKIEEKRFFIVTGIGSMFENGTIDRVIRILNDENKNFEIYQGIGGNPTTKEVEAGLDQMRAFKPDVVLGIGGGSAIDAAKVMTLLCEYDQLTIEDIRKGTAPQKREKIKLIAAPSTSGTGTEVTKTAVLTFEEEKIKIGLKTEAFIPDIAILDAQLTLSMPKHVVAESGMDALTHALEAYINKNADDFSKTMAGGAAVGIIKYLSASYEEGDFKNRQHVHNFQSLAGFAFQNAGLGMNHGIAHAFGGRFGTSHGLLNAIGLPYVLEYNSHDCDVSNDLNEISRVIGIDVIEKIEEMNQTFGIPKSFKEAGISEESFINHYDDLLEKSLMGSTIKNPVPMNAKEMDKVLKSIFYGNVIF